MFRTLLYLSSHFRYLPIAIKALELVWFVVGHHTAFTAVVMALPFVLQLLKLLLRPGGSFFCLFTLAGGCRVCRRIQVTYLKPLLEGHKRRREQAILSHGA